MFFSVEEKKIISENKSKDQPTKKIIPTLQRLKKHRLQRMLATRHQGGE